MKLDLGARDRSPKTIRERVMQLRSDIEEVTRDSGREPGAVTILAVTKRQPREAVVEAIDAGITAVGENYLQEARDKYVDLPPVRKHFIGHVQTNKAKPIVATFDVVQSVDRLEAGAALAKAARALGKSLRVLVQVNVSPAERFGIAPGEAPALAEALRDDGLIVDGVMAIGPDTGDRAEIAKAFAHRGRRRTGGRRRDALDRDVGRLARGASPPVRRWCASERRSSDRARHDQRGVAGPS